MRADRKCCARSGDLNRCASRSRRKTGVLGPVVRVPTGPVMHVRQDLAECNAAASRFTGDDGFRLVPQPPTGAGRSGRRRRRHDAGAGRCGGGSRRHARPPRAPCAGPRPRARRARLDPPTRAWPPPWATGTAPRPGGGTPRATTSGPWRRSGGVPAPSPRATAWRHGRGRPAIRYGPVFVRVPASWRNPPGRTFGPVRIAPARPPAARPRRAPRRGRVPPTCRAP